MTEPDYIKEISQLAPVYVVDEFLTLEEAVEHHDYLAKQIDLLSKQILYLFPDCPGEYIANGACCAAMMLLQDYQELIERQS